MRPKTIPSKPSECVAALSLKEDGQTQPYLSIFYTVLGDALHFFAYTVYGVREDVTPGETWLTYDEQGTTNPDSEFPLIQGTVYRDGRAIIERAEFSSESDALNYVAALRAVYQMAGELQGDDQG